MWECIGFVIKEAYQQCYFSKWRIFVGYITIITAVQGIFRPNPLNWICAAKIKNECSSVSPLIYLLAFGAPNGRWQFSCCGFHVIYADITEYILILIYWLWNATINYMYVALIVANVYKYKHNELYIPHLRYPQYEHEYIIKINQNRSHCISYFNKNVSGANITKLNLNKTRNYYQRLLNISFKFDAYKFHEILRLINSNKGTPHNRRKSSNEVPCS